MMTMMMMAEAVTTEAMTTEVSTVMMSTTVKATAATAVTTGGRGSDSCGRSERDDYQSKFTKHFILHL